MIAIVAAVLTRDPRTAGAVIGGGVLIGISLASIRGSVDAVVERRRARFILLVIVGRYALLAFLAYVMIARLRLSPLGLMAGASSLAAAAGVEALRFLWKNTRY